MNRQKLYFSDFDAERAYTLEYILEGMKERELTECMVFAAIRDNDRSHFFCKSFRCVFEKPPEGEPCGKDCTDYKPINGKIGCCKFRGFCYVPDARYKLSINCKLIPLANR